ncbi:MAG: phosphoribosylanthranilate isomerase [Gammaproteobacteria bacterium]|nr:MAG: phosphoribosylanthranilate isomerase [Gammaproteobacteria bacterium]
MRTRVKICGITRPEDAEAAVHAGADAIGLVFYPPSPRHVELAQAVEIARGLPPFVTTVGLFVNADAETIAEVVAEVGIDLIQFHGNECPDYCASHGRPWIRALRMKDDIDLEAEAGRFAAARGILLDAYRPGVPGGTGETFDWSRIPPALAHRIVLAGGLNPDNVEQAVRQVRPFAVDVSGGVESEPGIKDADRIARFMAAVRRGDEAR